MSAVIPPLVNGATESKLLSVTFHYLDAVVRNLDVRPLESDGHCMRIGADTRQARRLHRP